MVVAPDGGREIFEPTRKEKIIKATIVFEMNDQNILCIYEINKDEEDFGPLRHRVLAWFKDWIYVREID